MSEKEKYNFNVVYYKNNYYKNYVYGKVEILAQSNNFYRNFYLDIISEPNETITIKDINITPDDSCIIDDKKKKFMLNIYKVTFKVILNLSHVMNSLVLLRI